MAEISVTNKPISNIFICPLYIIKSNMIVVRFLNLFVFTVLFGLTLGLFNPGILVTVPFPQQPPQADLNLPISIDPILVNDLQLSKINLKSVQYSWSFTQLAVSVKISDAIVLFDWKFKSDYGQGTFTESQYEILLEYKFAQNPNNRIQIIILSSKSKLGHSSVHLGGTTKQTVIVEVTNLIMNHVAVLFRKAIEKTISGAVQSFSSIFDSDIKIFCQSSQTFCVYINSTLVSPPILSNKTLVIQLNGASYITGQKSGEINPQTALIKTNSSKIQGQVHVKVVEEILKKVLELIPQSFELDVASKFGTFDLNSLLVSPLFPLMAQYERPRQFHVLLSSIKATSFLNQSLQSIGAFIQFQINVLTKNSSTQSFDRFLPNNCNVNVSAGLKIIYGLKAISFRVLNLKMESIQCNEDDVRSGYVNPQAIVDVKQTMFTLLRTGINGQINPKILTLQFSGIQAALVGRILSEEVVFDLTLNPASSNLQTSQKQRFSLVLDH